MALALGWRLFVVMSSSADPLVLPGLAIMRCLWRDRENVVGCASSLAMAMLLMSNSIVLAWAVSLGK